MNPRGIRAEKAASVLVQPQGDRGSRVLVYTAKTFVIVRDTEEEFVMKRSEIPLPGAHNVENVLAAVIAARLAGVDANPLATPFAASRAWNTDWNL